MERALTLSMLDRQLASTKHQFANVEGHERAAYLFCSRSSMPSETRFLVRRVEFVQPDDIVSSSPAHISITSRSYVNAIVKASRENLSLFLIHSHPNGRLSFSEQDDREEREFIRTASNRAPDGPHGSVILAGNESPQLIGRVWLDEDTYAPLGRIRVVGKRMRLFDGEAGHVAVPPWADRQVQAFGPSVQALLSTLHVGVVGAGGTGSALCEQLIRLGVGHLTVIDEQEFESTNVNRLYGSGLADNGVAKTTIVERQATRIGTGTKVEPIQGSVCTRNIAEALRSCDVVFGCTDDHFGREILNRLSLWYYIPVIDMAVAVDSTDGVIREVTGRVTVLLPGNACLTCRGRVSQAGMAADVLRRSHPEEYARRVEEGYAPELRVRDPAVVMFTTGIAARAMMEFMHILTGYMGEDRMSSEVIERFHETDVRKNAVQGNPGCYCTTPEQWGRGDKEPFLGIIW